MHHAGHILLYSTGILLALLLSLSTCILLSRTANFPPVFFLKTYHHYTSFVQLISGLLPSSRRFIIMRYIPVLIFQHSYCSFNFSCDHMDLMKEISCFSFPSKFLYEIPLGDFL